MGSNELLTICEEEFSSILPIYNSSSFRLQHLKKAKIEPYKYTFLIYILQLMEQLYREGGEEKFIKTPHLMKIKNLWDNRDFTVKELKLHKSTNN